MSSPDLADAAQSIFSSTNPEVWLITATAEHRRGGLLATWVKQVSIDPTAPTLAVALDVTHYTNELVAASGAFTAHLIRPDQVELALGFAIGSGRDRDKLAGLRLADATSKSPILADCAAWLDCRVYDSKDTGDRVYYWADVVAAEQHCLSERLTVVELLARATPEQLAALQAARLADIATLGPIREAYRRELT